MTMCLCVFFTRLFSKYWQSMINEQKRGSQPDFGEASPLQSSTRNGKPTKTHGIQHDTTDVF